MFLKILSTSLNSFGKGVLLTLMCFIGQLEATELSLETRNAVDALVAKSLAQTLVPSASIAIVVDGHIAYAKAYGLARLEPATPATESMRYKIASNSKQITAAAILRLVEMRKLSVEDRVSKFFPDLTRARDITVRQLLAHTSGYSDYFPEDYLPTYVESPVTPLKIMEKWAQKPLDFEPGTRYQYSSTGYVILGQIIEKITGQSLIAFLRSQFFEPIGILSVADVDLEAWSATDPQGYTRFALGPIRPAKSEGPGWFSASGQLAMTASDLARWNIALAEGKVLSAASLRELTLAVPLRDGTSTRYALGLGVSQMTNGKRRWAHFGGASGFLSVNINFPDDKASITVLTNGEGKAINTLASQLEKLLIEPTRNPLMTSALDRAKELLIGLQKGTYDRDLVTNDLASYFNPLALSDFALTLGPLGAITSMREESYANRGGMVLRNYSVVTEKQKLSVETYVMSDGRLHQFLVFPN